MKIAVISLPIRLLARIPVVAFWRGPLYTVSEVQGISIRNLSETLSETQAETDQKHGKHENTIPYMVKLPILIQPYLI